jgi:hypothetical protein
MPSTVHVEGEERRITMSEEQLVELRTTSVVEPNDFSVADGTVLNCIAERCGKRGEGVKLMAISRYERTFPLALLKVAGESRSSIRASLAGNLYVEWKAKILH